MPHNYITERNSEAIHLYGLASAAMGTTVLWAAMNGGVPMPEAAHGEAIHIIPAWIWAVSVMTQGWCLMLFCAMRLRLLLAITGLFGCLINAYLAMFAGDAVFGFLVARGAGLFAVMHGGIAISAGLDAAWSVLMKYWDRIDD